MQADGIGGALVRVFVQFRNKAGQLLVG
ncbi:hypothetical protein RB2654_14245 [Rhodobacterales bacterium HTCC2654]|uniref:Uncharacterized protein n=1 Tax=Maritimibacter alkaliphilus HTCC2654 TaxID=314271 RepID=A3VGP8_9RHOB|nr:hypothetical protein RB2654_14245 [Rhodobacterales bacterium HTCC2654] [Maritimibacter alkaliphilus HTCC2654]